MDVATAIALERVIHWAGIVLLLAVLLCDGGSDDDGCQSQ